MLVPGAQNQLDESDSMEAEGEMLCYNPRCGTRWDTFKSLKDQITAIDLQKIWLNPEGQQIPLEAGNSLKANIWSANKAPIPQALNSNRGKHGRCDAWDESRDAIINLYRFRIASVNS